MRAKSQWGVVLGALGLAALGGTAPSAQEMEHEMAAPAACTAPAAPGSELAPWTTPVFLIAAGSERRASRARLAVGQAARLTLLPTPQVRFPHRPERPGGAVSYGGVLRIDVAEAATYRVALSSAVWVDLVHGGTAVMSVGHGHGPACTGIRKMVDYSLQPGRYTVQIAANGEQAITVLVAQLP